MDRNPKLYQALSHVRWSLSARRAWIEMLSDTSEVEAATGSLSARRAWIEIPAGCWRQSRLAVALRKESVDRNLAHAMSSQEVFWSLSARRAWIEIGLNFARKIRPVASLSARRAWIEICCACCSGWLLAVALRKESVDRNL